MAGDVRADVCLACGLSSGRIPLPGGQLHRSEGWLVDHGVGPLGVGTLLVKPERHVEHVAGLTAEEAAAMGPLLHLGSQVVTELCRPDQVYVCLWSHAGFQPVGAAGPAYHSALFAARVEPSVTAVEEFCQRAKTEFAVRTMPG